MSTADLDVKHTIISIGNFDGVHLGHAALVRTARRLADATADRGDGGGRVVVMAFDPHPSSRLAPEHAPSRLGTFDRRAELLRELGADEVIKLEPTGAFLAQSPVAFIEEVCRRYAPAAFVEGADFRFGKGRAGDIAGLRAIGNARGFGVEVVPAVEVALQDHTLVRASSSLARWLIARGRVQDARALLGRAYELDGIVEKGDQRGRQIGFRTANLTVDPGVLLPGDGVYACTATVRATAETRTDVRVAPAMVNIGKRPTFRGLHRTIEAHVLDDVAMVGLPEYGYRLSLAFEGWVRDQVRFESVAALVDQLGRDRGCVSDMLRSPAVAR